MLNLTVCSQCLHVDTCKYTTDYLLQEEDISKIVTRDPLKIKIICDFYISKLVINFKGGTLK